MFRERYSHMDMGVWLWWALLGFLALFIVIAYHAHKTRQANLAKYRSWAKSRGFDFVDKDKPLGKELKIVFGIPGSGHKAQDIVVMPSSQGKCLYGVVKWTEGSGENQEYYSNAFVRFDIQGSLPSFLLKPEGAMSRKYNDITTEWDDFNREWEIRCDDREFALALLTPVMQEFIMANMRGKELRIDGSYAYLRLGDEYDIERSVGRRALMEDWAQLILPFLWERSYST